MTDIYRPSFAQEERPPGFQIRRARIGFELGTELIGCSLWELPRGETAYPYHFHYSDEELLIVIRGRPTLRTPDGVRELDEGEAVRFAVGEQGAHQLLNRSPDTVTFLARQQQRPARRRRLCRLQQDRRERAACARRRPARVLPPRGRRRLLGSRGTTQALITQGEGAPAALLSGARTKRAQGTQTANQDREVLIAHRSGATVDINGRSIDNSSFGILGGLRA